MPLKGNNTSNTSTIKDYLSATENQSTKTRNAKEKNTTIPNECVATSSKQPNKTYNTTKEANAKSKPKIQTMQSNCKDMASTPTSNNDHTPSTQKRNATNRSPLEGHSDKKQRESNMTKTNNKPLMEDDNSYHKEEDVFPKATDEHNTTENMMDMNDTGPSLNSSRVNPDGNNTEVSLSTLLTELRDIKVTILNLDSKIDTSHQELSEKLIDNKDFYDHIASQDKKILELQQENNELKIQNTSLENEIDKTQEDMLRLKVDMAGIHESGYESYEDLRKKIAEIMTSVCEGTTEAARWETSINIPIVDCFRIGTYTRNKKRPVRITFLFMRHKLCLLNRRSSLPKGIFVDNAHTPKVLAKRATLRPILNLARKNNMYKGKCKLEGDCLIITGTKYTLDTLDKLPQDLAPYKAAQKSTQDTLVFHGPLTPLSNFHKSPFIVGTNKYHSTEQYIQYQKACHFKDYQTAGDILKSKTPIDSKTLSRNIVNYDKESWKTVAKEVCKNGIAAKFEQNPLLLQFLLATRPLKLAESSYDRLWGTGIHLNDDKALDQTYWYNQGILGEVLTEIRDTYQDKL